MVFIAFMAASLGLSLWFPVVLPVAVGGFSLYMGLLVCRSVKNKSDGSVAYFLTSVALAFSFLLLSVRFAMDFSLEYSGELFCRDILPFLNVSFH